MKMNKRKWWGRGGVLFPVFTAVIAVATFSLSADRTAKEFPRRFSNIYPPPPEGGVINLWRFDEAVGMRSGAPDPLFSENVGLFESWSGNSVSLFGNDPAYLRFPESDAAGNVHLNSTEGSVRFWFSPHWGSADLGGIGPGTYARLIEMGAADERARVGWWSLYLNPEGNRIHFSTQGRGRSADYLAAPILWEPGSWHEVTLTYSPEGTALYVDGLIAAEGGGITTVPDAATRQEFGFALGGDASGGNLAQGEFDELTTYHGALDAEEVARVYHVRAMQVWRQAMDNAGLLQAQPSSSGGMALMSSPPSPGSGGGGGSGTNTYMAYSYSTNDLWLKITGKTNTTGYFVIYTPEPSEIYDLFATTNLSPNVSGLNLTNWVQVVRTTSGQTNLTITGLSAVHEYFQLGTMYDGDGDGLPDAYETLVSHSDLASADTDGDGLADVSDPSPLTANGPASFAGRVIAYCPQ